MGYLAFSVYMVPSVYEHAVQVVCGDPVTISNGNRALFSGSHKMEA
jgi:hypothetical protein